MQNFGSKVLPILMLILIIFFLFGCTKDGGSGDKPGDVNSMDANSGGVITGGGNQGGGNGVGPSDVNSIDSNSGGVVTGGRNQGESNSNARFVDNRDGTIFDNNTGLTWLKCDFGLKGANCDTADSMLQNASAYSQASGQMVCYKANSGFNTCENGALCKDGEFVVVDYAYELANHKEDYGATDIPTALAQGCYIQVPIAAKERACASHGGLQNGNWALPEFSKIKTLYENKSGVLMDINNQTEIDTRTRNIDQVFFPNSQGYYVTSTIDPLIRIGGGTLVYSFTNDDKIAQSSGRAKCVTTTPSAPIQTASAKCYNTTHGLDETTYYSGFDITTNSCGTNMTARATTEHWAIDNAQNVYYLSKGYPTSNDFVDATTNLNASISDYMVETIVILNKITRLNETYTKSGSDPQYRKFVYVDSQLEFANQYNLGINKIYGSDCKCTYNSEIYTGATGEFNGKKCYYLKTPITVTTNGTENRVGKNVYDCINLEYCEPVLEKVYFNDCLNTSSVVNPLSKDVSLDLFTPPTNFFEVDSQPNLPDTNFDSSNTCVEKCQQMDENCSASGQISNSTGTGCYTPSDDPNAGYQRNCYSVCLSS